MNILLSRRTAFVLFVLAAAGLQADAVRALIAHSRGEASASHVVLIPFLSSMLIYQRRAMVFSAVRWEPRIGFAVLACGLLCALSVQQLRSPDARLSVSIASLVLAWVGAFVLFFGAEAFRRGRFALLFLIFTIPFPQSLLNEVTEVLKVLSTEAVDVLMTAISLPHYRDEFVFHLPGVSIEVADACSGIRSTIALTLTALLTGHTVLASGWGRTVLLLTVVPITVFKNGIRIVALSWLATNGYPEALDSWLHRDGGVVFFLLALGLLAPVLAVVRRLERRGVRGRELNVTQTLTANADHVPAPSSER